MEGGACGEHDDNPGRHAPDLVLVLVPIESLVIGAPIARFRPLFWLEAVAVVAFGVAWLVKGQAVLKDPPNPPPPG